MNKDVIYIEPEDDITDIILKIENSKEKIVALVPPKKAGVFRSVVNIKLIAKAGVTADKTVVLVTVDPSILKLAASAKLPVAKNLQSAPSVPQAASIDEDDTTEEEELVEEEGEEEEETEEEGEEDEEESEKDEEKEEEEEEEEKPAKKKPAKKKSGKKKGLINWIKLHKKISIFLGIFAIGIAVLLFWMLFIAPAVEISVPIKTDMKNFSESVTFVDKLEDEDAKEGKFFLEQKKLEETQKVEFDATGQKNRGERAHGKLKVSTYFNGAGSVAINGGKTQFTYNGLNYVADKDYGLIWDGRNPTKCENTDIIVPNPSGASTIRCLISETVEVTAVEGGAKYNAAASGTGWSTLSGIGVVSITAMEGGTDDIITVVKQSDIIAAQDKIVSSKAEENKEKLYAKIDKDKYYVIDSSFEQSTSNAVSTPAADEEVKEGVKPSLEATTTATVYVIDKIKLEEFINNKAELSDDQKIYDIKDIYVENMDKIAVGVSSKLKAQYFIGPELTEAKLVEMIKGRGLGDARREIESIHGVSDITINTSYPWVMAVPNDSNKITIKFEVVDQNKDEKEGEEAEENKDEEKKDDKKEEKKDKKE